MIQYRRFKAAGLTAALLCMLLAAAGCGGAGNFASSEDSEGSENAEDSEDEEDVTSIQTASELDVSDMFTDRDYETDYEDSAGVLITLEGTTVTCDGDGVSTSDGFVTLAQEGTYLITGTMTDGTILVDAGDDAKVWIILQDADITSADFAAIYVRSADKVFLTLADGTENTLTNEGTFTEIDENTVDAVIFSKSDLTINGNGTLTVTSAAGHGIVSKDDLVITGGNLTVTAGSGHALSANDSVRIAAGTLVLTSSKDGIQAENDEDTQKGFVYISGGELTIISDGDGISSSGETLIDGGTFTITAGGGSDSADDSEFVNQMQQRMQASRAYSSGSQDADTTEDTSSCKGIKASGLLTIRAGEFYIDSADDSIHSNSDVTIYGGELTILSGDDGMHADEALTIEDAVITIEDSYEGLEGMDVCINGGTISIVSSDDGINAAGGNDESGYDGWRQDDRFGTSSAGDYTLVINGGTISIDAGGDGIDSNGSLTITGGETYISAAIDSMNGAVDYTTSGTMTGGILIAAGSSSMAMNMSEASQGCVLITTGSQSAAEVSILDSSGTVLAACTLEKSFSSVLISCPQLEAGQTYTLTIGTEETDITLSNTISSVSIGSTTGAGRRGGF